MALAYQGHGTHLPRPRCLFPNFFKKNPNPNILPHSSSSLKPSSLNHLSYQTSIHLLESISSLQRVKSKLSYLQFHHLRGTPCFPPSLISNLPCMLHQCLFMTNRVRIMLYLPDFKWLCVKFYGFGLACCELYQIFTDLWNL